MMIICSNPFIAMSEFVLDQPLLDQCLAMNLYDSSTVNDLGTNKIKTSGSRTSSTYIDQDDSYQAVRLAILDHINKTYATDYTLYQTELTQFTKYELGQEYRPHWDYFNHPSHNAEDNDRVATAILYLNDDFEGGYTDFPLLNVTIKPVKNHLLYFTYTDPSTRDYTMHAGTPVISGVKQIITLWIRETNYGIFL